MTVDSTLTFAARRQVPIRYDRELVAKTLQAMQRVSEIKSRRERKFYQDRMAGNKERQLETDKKLIESHGHLLVKPLGRVQATTDAMEIVSEEAERVKIPILLKRKAIKQKFDVAASGSKMDMD